MQTELLHYLKNSKKEKNEERNPIRSHEDLTMETVLYATVR